VPAGWPARSAPASRQPGTSSWSAPANQTPPRLSAGTIGNGTAHGDIVEAARHGEVILLAFNRAGIPEALTAAGDLQGKTLIDCNNPRPRPRRRRDHRRGDSGAIRRERRQGVQLLPLHVWAMKPPVFDGRPLVVPYCGDDDTAKEHVRQLIEEMGCRPLDLGGLAKARHIEYLAATVIGLLFEGADPTTVFNLVDAAE
jgi:8-hydroxy-5-deazaflavin:NADPH oxidoreductase